MIQVRSMLVVLVMFLGFSCNDSGINDVKHNKNVEVDHQTNEFVKIEREPVKKNKVDPSTNNAETTIEQLIKQLDDDDFEKREEATAILIRKGIGSIPTYASAEKNTDSPEIRIRLKKIIENILDVLEKEILDKENDSHVEIEKIINNKNYSELIKQRAFKILEFLYVLRSATNSQSDSIRTLVNKIADSTKQYSSRAKLLLKYPNKKILGNFVFDKNGKNFQGKAGFKAKNGISFKNGCLVSDGKYGGRNAFYCSEMNHKKFSVALRFNPKSIEKDKTNIIVCGYSYRWFGLSVSERGFLTVTLNNQDDKYETDIVIKKGEWSSLVCSVDVEGKTIDVYKSEGEKSYKIDLPSDFSLRVLQDKRDDREWTFQNYSNGNVFHGKVDDLQIHDKNLSRSEMKIVLKFMESNG